MKPHYPSLFSLFRKLILMIAAAGITSLANAQVANYAFSQLTGTYTPITGGTVLVTGGPADDNTFAAIPIGFTFVYNATSYTQVSIAANGYIKFGATAPGCCWYNGTSIQNEAEAIHPFSEDLYGNNPACELRYQTIGTPGSQIFVVQWKDWGFWATGNAEINFQARLYEGSNTIEFAYSPATIVTAQTCQVGLTGTTVADFNSRTTTTSWTTTTASTLNTEQMTFSTGVFPPAGLSYFWTLVPIDIAPISLVAPVPNMCYTANETVTVRVRNFGSQAVDFSVNPMTVNCWSTNTNPVAFPPVVVNSGILATSATQDVVITTTYNMTTAGMYTFTASTNTTGDGNPINDSLLPVNIDGNITAGVASLQPATDSICQGDTATLILTGYTGAIQWQSFDGVAWNNETGPGNNTAAYPVSPVTTTTYRAVVCGTAISNTVTLTIVVVPPPVTTGDTRCGYGVVNLSATGTGDMVWYSEPTGGQPLFTGNTYSPIVSVTDTFYVEATFGSGNPAPLTTTFAAGNGQNGNMFNITALNTVTITHFDGHMATGTQNFTIYYRPGTFIGFETDSSTWINLGTAVGVVAQGAGNPTPIPIMFNVTIPAGQTYGFYVTAHAGTVSYTNGTSLDAVYVQDANIQVRQGKGNVYPFGGSFSPRIWNGIVYYESGCASATRTPVIATVTPAAAVTVTASQTLICGAPASTTITLNASSTNPSYNYTWTGADLNQTTGPSVTATPNATTTYIVTGDDGTCADTAAIVIVLAAPPPASAMANPVTICMGQPSQFSTPPGQVTAYNVNSIAYAPVTFTGNAGPAGDNVLSVIESIGFTFNYFGTDYTQFRMCTNGNIQFGPTYSTSTLPALIPTATGLNNYIGAPWANLSTVIGGNITWATLGAAPNRMLVVSFNNMGFNTGGGFLNSQIILYEGTNCIEIHSSLVSNTTLNKTMGIENQNGSIGFAPPGRNQGNWNFSTPEAWSFCPVMPLTFVWNPVTWLNSSTIYNPALTPLSTGNFTYDVTVTDPASGCTSTSSVTVSVVAVPVAPTSSNLTRCGTGTVTLTATAGGPGTLQWFTEPVGGSPFATGSPVTSPVISVTDTFYVEEFDGNCPGPRTMVIVTVTPPVPVSVSASQTVLCSQPSATMITLTASSTNPSYTYTWTGADLNQTTGPVVTANPSDTITYVVLGDDGTCADTASVTIILIIPPPAAATANPANICLGQPSQLNTPPGQVTYTVNSIPFAPLTFTGNEGPIGDDVIMPPNPQPPLPIGFTFNYFGTDYTAFKISTNGNIQFGPTFSTTFTTAIIPTTTGLNNYIGIPWCDMFVDTTQGQHIKWATLGTAPNRMLVVSYDSVRAFSGGGFYKSQVILYEGTNCVQIHSAFVTNTTANKVMGLENQNGTVGMAAPGRNNVNFNFNTPEAWSFCPVSPYTFIWTPNTWLSSDTIYNPVLTPASAGNFTYTVTVTDITSGCTSTSSVAVSAVVVPAAPTSSNLTRCGTGTVQLTATASGPGTLQWFDVPIGGVPFATGSPVTSPVISFTDTFYVEEFDGNCPGPRTAVIVTVTPADTIIATSTANPMCAGNPVTISISSINPGYSYSWSPAIGLSSTTGSPVTANPPFTTLYTINAIDGAGCETSTSINLVVNPSPVVAATANPITVCSGTPTQLDINNTSAPIEFTVGTGTITNTPTSYPAPYGNFWWGARHQMLITQAELLAAGISAGNLYSLAFDVVAVNSCPPLVNFEIKMMNTTATNMSAWLTGLTSVYLNPLYTPVVGWNTHTFSTPFTWDGVSNIVIETCFNNSSWLNNGNCTFNQTATSYVSSRWRNADLATVCTNPTSVSGTLSRRPNMRFGVPSIFSYVWTPNTALSSDTIPNPVASPTSSTTYTVSVTDNYWNCTSTSSITINVNPLPVVTFSPLSSICIDGSPLPLTGGTPTGGVYSGPGVTNNIFYPAVAGVGTHTIVYVYTDNFGCAGMDSTTITVNDLPVVALPTFPDACVSTNPITLNTGTPLGGTYSGPGVSAGIFDPNAAGAGIHGITYTYTDGNGCTNSALRNIVVHDAPVANAGPDINGNATITNASASGGTPPYTYIWSPCLDMLNCNTLTPFVNPQVNTYYVLYVIDANGCYSTDTVLVSSTIGIAAIPVENSGLLVYPNPASGQFNILFFNPNDKAEVTIANSIGQVVYSSGIFTAPALPYQVNLTSQPDGIYVMQVKYRDRIITSRLVLNK